ncbi:hypothetical protein Bbelb_261770 [Branchiostoma belcheri]|nr:hypothetical protein Bbelb_261770 [Branchiostoma belcheri]
MLGNQSEERLARLSELSNPSSSFVPEYTWLPYLESNSLRREGRVVGQIDARSRRPGTNSGERILDSVVRREISNRTPITTCRPSIPTTDDPITRALPYTHLLIPPPPRGA